MKTYTISNGTPTAEIRSIIDEASSGDNIVFEAGTYFEDNGTAALSLQNVDFDPNNPLVFSSQGNGEVVFDGTTSIIDSEGIVFDGITFQDRIEPTGKPEHPDYGAVAINSSSYIEIRNSTITGNLLQPEDTVSEDDFHRYDGFYVGIGVSISGRGSEGPSQSITIENSEITELKTGIRIDGTEDVIIQGNAIHKIRRDGIFSANHADTEVTENFFAEFRPRRVDYSNPNGKTDEHGDAIQYYTTPGGSGISNFTIRENIFFDASSTFSDNDLDYEHLQIIQGRETRGEMLPNDGNDFNNFVIEDNLIYAGHINALRIEDVNGGSIKNNTLISNAEVPSRNSYVPDGAVE